MFVRIVLSAIFLFSFSAQASATVFGWELSNGEFSQHGVFFDAPDSVTAATGGVMFRLDFDHPDSNMMMFYDDVLNAITISGQSHGFLTPTLFGSTKLLEGTWDIFFQYDKNVVASADRSTITVSSVLDVVNSGTFAPQFAIPGLTGPITLFDKGPMGGSTFDFIQRPGQLVWDADAWLRDTAFFGFGFGGTVRYPLCNQMCGDWHFVATSTGVVPEPATLLLLGSGLLFGGRVRTWKSQ